MGAYKCMKLSWGGPGGGVNRRILNIQLPLTLATQKVSEVELRPCMGEAREGRVITVLKKKKKKKKKGGGG